VTRRAGARSALPVLDAAPQPPPAGRGAGGAGGQVDDLAGDVVVPPDPARAAAGWERRFVADGARAEEMIRLYRELGFEVETDPVRAEELTGPCEGCRVVALLRFQVVYTRRPPTT
jgi:hypothetical protein